MMPELYLADALGAAGKPMMRVHTAGSVGGSTAIVAAQPRAGGRPRARAHRRVREAVARATRCGRSSVRDAVPAAARRRRRRLLRAAHPRVHAPLGRARRHRHHGRGEGPPERAARTRTRTCSIPDITLETVEESPMLWDPIRYLETCPSSDGAMRDGARRARTRPTRRPSPPAWIHGTRDAQRADDVRRPRPGQPAGRAATARRTSTRRPASPTRASEIDCAEIYVPFSLVRADVAREPRLLRPRATAGS